MSVKKDALLVAFFDVSQPFSLSGKEGTEAKIIDGARRCFFHYGPDKVSMNDVAEMAGVSRASVYNYFPSREALLEAVIDLVGTVFSEALGRAMAKGDTFETQVAEGVMNFLTWTQAGLQHFGTPSYEHILKIFTTHSSPTFNRTVDAVLPYVELAWRRGELRADLNVEWAAEWVTRILWSFVHFEPRAFNGGDPRQITAFVQQHLVRGLR